MKPGAAGSRRGGGGLTRKAATRWNWQKFQHQIRVSPLASEIAGRLDSGGIAPEAKQRITVGVSDMGVSNDPNSFLITYSLGPCIGLILYDRLVRAGGLLHFQLPSSRGHDARARENPYMFGDIGIPLLLQKMERLGAQKDRLIVSVFGGASMMQDENIFKIGIQNTRTTKKILWQQCMSINNEDVGGQSSRTVSIDVENGEIRLRSEGKIFQYK